MVLLLSAVQSTHDPPYPLDPVYFYLAMRKKKQIDIGSIIYLPMIFLELMTLIYFGDFPARHEGLDVDFHCNWVMGCPWSHLESRSIPMATLPRPHTPTLVDVPSSSGNWSTPLYSQYGNGSSLGPQDLEVQCWRVGMVLVAEAWCSWILMVHKTYIELVDLDRKGRRETDRQTDVTQTDLCMYIHTHLPT